MTKLKELGGSFREAKTDDAGKKSYPVVIISQGMGNLADRNYYTKEAIESGPAVYEGKQAYYDHPTPDDERQRPGRSVKELCGHYENCKVSKDKDGLAILVADFVPMKNSEVVDLIEHEIEFRKKYKDDKHFVGISINGDGEGSQMAYDDFVKEVSPSKLEMEKISQVEGQKINVITKFTEALSADFVTAAGAKGRILKEQNLKQKRSRNMGLIEEMKKFIQGAAAGDKKRIKEATQALLEKAKEDEDEGKKEADAKEAAEKEHMEKAKKIMAHMDQCKKEMKQHEDESAKEYEARCMAAAMKKHEDESAKKEDESEEESEDAQEDESTHAGKSSGHHASHHGAKSKKFKASAEDESEDEDGEDDDQDADDKGGDDEKPKKKAKKDDSDDDSDDDAAADESEDESKESADGDDDADDDHPDAGKDKKLVKKMVKPGALQKEIESLKKEIESLKKEKKEADEKAHEGKKESAKVKIELAAKDRMILVESMLSKSGLPRAITEQAELSELLKRAKTKEEMQTLLKTYKTVWDAGIRESFSQVSEIGFPEMTGSGDGQTADELFK